MANCKRCGAELPEGARFCPNCAYAVNASDAESGWESAGERVREQFDHVVGQFKNMEDSTEHFTEQDISGHRVMAILAYLGILVLVPIFASPDSRFTRFHANQGLVLLLASLVYGGVRWIVVGIFDAVWWVLAAGVRWIFNLGCLVFVVYIVLGILHAARGEAKELPFIGKVRILR